MYIIQSQHQGLWRDMESFTDIEPAEAQLAHLNGLHINGKPYATLRLIHHEPTGNHQTA